MLGIKLAPNSPESLINPVYKRLCPKPIVALARDSRRFGTSLARSPNVYNEPCVPITK